MRKIGAIIVVLFASVFPACSHMDSYTELCKTCPDADIRLQSCTKVIESGQVSGAYLAETYVRRGIINEGKMEYDPAVRDFNQAILLDPYIFEAFYHRGYLFEKKGDHEQAIRDFNQAIKLNPGYVYAYISRGVAYRGKGEYDRAIQEFNKAIEMNPYIFETFYSRGFTYEMMGQHDKALEDFDQAVGLDTNNLIVHYNRGNEYYRMGDFDWAVRDYDKAIKLNPAYANTYNNRGNAYRSMGQYERAIQDYDQAIQLNPNNSIQFRNRGAARFFLGQYPAAEQDFAVARSLNPNDPYGVIWEYLAQTRAHLGASIALSDNAGHPNPTVWPGQVISLFKGTITKEGLLSSAQSKDPVKNREQHCEAYFYLGEQALRQGKTDEARSLFKQAEETGVVNFIEYSGAQVELKQLTQKLTQK
ncbi:MAG TPA: tetratricopeptide repeat protein [Desulfomonilia bacterium]|nr:tetratricopeptide repeat protein [Desulfomonilia bacterium]